jgi:transcriptional regulator with XRE-family HTH domain
MYPNLKLKIFLRGSHQNRLAKSVGIDETVLSKIIHGYRKPTTMQRKLLADFLEADEAWLFEQFDLPEPRTEGIEIAPIKGSSQNGDD